MPAPNPAKSSQAMRGKSSYKKTRPAGVSRIFLRSRIWLDPVSTLKEIACSSKANLTFSKTTGSFCASSITAGPTSRPQTWEEIAARASRFSGASRFT